MLTRYSIRFEVEMILNPLNFLERFFTHRAIERELSIEKEKVGVLQSENEKLREQKKELENELHRIKSVNKTNRRPFAISEDHPDGY
jgi:cell shape-determining protein MreC